MNAVIRFRPRRRQCECCGYSFIPARTWHRACRKCYSWTRLAICQRRMAGLLEGAR